MKVQQVIARGKQGKRDLIPPIFSISCSSFPLHQLTGYLFPAACVSYQRCSIVVTTRFISFVEAGIMTDIPIGFVELEVKEVGIHGKGIYHQ